MQDYYPILEKFLERPELKALMFEKKPIIKRFIESI
jgi:hypothetical protein